MGIQSDIDDDDHSNNDDDDKFNHNSSDSPSSDSFLSDNIHNNKRCKISKKKKMNNGNNGKREFQGMSMNDVSTKRRAKKKIIRRNRINTICQDRLKNYKSTDHFEFESPPNNISNDSLHSMGYVTNINAVNIPDNIDCNNHQCSECNGVYHDDGTTISSVSASTTSPITMSPIRLPSNN